MQWKRNFLYFKQPNIPHRVPSGLSLFLATLSISAGHILVSHITKIHVITIVTSTHISYTWCLRFRYSGQKFCGLIFSPPRPRHNEMFRSPRHWTMVSHNFRRKIFLLCSKGRIVFEVCPFQSQTLPVCRNVCNHLPSNVASYNRRWVRLFIPLFKTTNSCNCMNHSSSWISYNCYILSDSATVA